MHKSVGALPPQASARRIAASGRSDRRLPSIVPGMALAAGIAVVATLVGDAAPVIGAPVFAIVIGIAIALVRTPGASFRPGIRFASKNILQGSIIVLGLGLSVHQVLETGIGSLPVLVGTLVIVLAVAYVAAKVLKIDADDATLVGVGTAICGASAIAAVDAVISAKESKVSYAIATIFTFNVVAVLLYPSIGHLLGLSQHAFGLWAGTAINDTSSVVAASTVYGSAAASYAVVVKLTRTLAIIPICIYLSWRRAGRTAAVAPGSGQRQGFSIRRTFPLFIVGFLLAVVLNTVGLVPEDLHDDLARLAAWMITAALAAIGLSTRLDQMRRAGLRPLALGAILWATVGFSGLALQLLTGTI